MFLVQMFVSTMLMVNKASCVLKALTGQTNRQDFKLENE